MLFPSASPLALTSIASSGRLALPVDWNGPERSTFTSPPSEPSFTTFIESPISPLSIPSKVASSITFSGSSLLPPPPPPQALRTAARTAKAASRARVRLRLKGQGSFKSGNGGREGHCTRSFFAEAPAQRFRAWRALFVRGDAGGERQRQGADHDQGDPDADQPAQFEEVSADADHEAG